MKLTIAILGCFISFCAVAQSFDEGWKLIYQRSFDKAEAIFRKLDKEGDAKGSFGLGVMHQFGYGKVQKDYKAAMKLYVTAAKSNVPEAIHNVGYLYQHGLGVERNLKSAVGWYTKSADLGYPISQYDLAAMYYEGWGVPKDLKKAFTLYTRAASSGLPQALYNVGYMYGKGEGVERNYALAYAYTKSANLLGEKVDSRELPWYERRLSAADRERANGLIAKLTQGK